MRRGLALSLPEAPSRLSALPKVAEVEAVAELAIVKIGV
jgi:hypothetical protein